MKSMRLILLLISALVIISCAKKTDNSSEKALLVEQLKNSHSNEEWFVPINKAVEGLTAEQANWRDSSDNHSISQLVSHLTFWNSRVLIGFKGNTPPNFDGNNDRTFTPADGKQWESAVKRIDSLQTVWEQMVEGATDAQLKEWRSSIANIASHNAYHTGQIIYIRKQNGWWKPKEVKKVK